MANERGNFSAAPSALGYLYQVRYALLQSLQRLKKEHEFSVSIETLDDVVFEQEGKPTELLQTKHNLKRTADLTDASSNLWKTIRIWSLAMTDEKVFEGTIFYLITTGEVSEGSAAYYLGAGPERNVVQAMQSLNSTASTSNNKSNILAYQAYLTLDVQQRKELLEAIHVIDKSPQIEEVHQEIRSEIFHAVELKYLEALIQRLEGWWYKRVISHLVSNDSGHILGEEVYSELADLREQFKQDNLPIDEDIISATIDASSYQDSIFVQQLKLIEISDKRIFSAIRNYFRAFQHRSRWIREDLLLVGELSRYEDRLIEEWENHFNQMEDELGTEATEEEKKNAAKTLYKWIETGLHPFVRPNVTEASISRGTYQILSNGLQAGWHVEFADRIRILFETKGGLS